MHPAPHPVPLPHSPHAELYYIGSADWGKMNYGIAGLEVEHLFIAAHGGTRELLFVGTNSRETVLQFADGSCLSLRFDVSGRVDGEIAIPSFKMKEA